MPDSSICRHTINVDHVQISCARPFAEVWATLQKDAPALDPQLAQDLTAARTDAIAERRANGPKLWLFLTRDHGALLAAEDRRERALQLEIGNPLTAERMTRRHLGAALYAPLRVVLYQDAQGRAVFEYDLPSSLFGQFGDPEIAAVGQELDEELEKLLLNAAN
jgi:uncharacterized protein (DUF302 family)